MKKRLIPCKDCVLWYTDYDKSQMEKLWGVCLHHSTPWFVTMTLESCIYCRGESSQ